MAEELACTPTAPRWPQADCAVIAASRNILASLPRTTMDPYTLLLAILTLCLTGVTFHAWRLGSETRDVVLLGLFSGLLGAGTAVTAIL